MPGLFTSEDIEALKSCLWPVVAVVVVVLLDILSGIIKALIAGNLKSSIMREGLAKKSAYFILIIIFVMVNLVQIHFQFWPEFPTVSVICALICVCEVISIVENAAEINPEIKNWPIIKEILGYKISEAE